MTAHLGHLLFWICLCAGLAMSLPEVAGEIFFGNFGAAAFTFIAYVSLGFVAGYALRFALTGVRDPLHNTRKLIRRIRGE